MGERLALLSYNKHTRVLPAWSQDGLAMSCSHMCSLALICPVPVSRTLLDGGGEREIKEGPRAPHTGKAGS